jgi:CheY-like chemotaxis protein
LLARNGEEALAGYCEFREKIAVVLTDMDMPVMDGPATVIALKKVNPRVRIIGSSGLFPNEKFQASSASSVQRFVPKPYGAESLLRAVMEVLIAPSRPAPER